MVSVPFMAPDTPPLTGVQVEFRGADNITLTPAVPAQTVTLRQGYLATLLREPRNYQYRVTNLHADGAGARGEWQDDQLGTLDVTPA